MNAIHTAVIGSTTASTVGSFRLPRLEHARVEDAMHPGLISISPDTPLREVARVLASHHIHCVLVTSPVERGRVPHWGLITATELVRAATDGVATSFEERSAAELATDTPPTVSSAEQLASAAKLMAEHGTEHLIVLGASDGHPVGVLSALDIAGVLAWGEG